MFIKKDINKEEQKTTRQEINKDKQQEILEEEKKEKRKKWIIFTFKIMVLIIVLMTGFYFYTVNYGTKGLIVKETRITNKKIPESFSSAKIVHFSDLLYGTTIQKKELETLVSLINSRKPDIIVFTGDLIDKSHTMDNGKQEEFISILKGLNATVGKYAVSGDEDDEETFQTILKQSNFKVLNDDYDLVYKKDNTPILMIGLSSLNKQTRDVENAYRYFKEETHNSDIFTILLMHETNGLDKILGNYPTDLVLAGHSLGGRMRIPGLSPFIKKEGSSKYDDTFYQVNNTKVFVSSGIGTNNYGLRLFQRPSINLFRLSP